MKTKALYKAGYRAELKAKKIMEDWGFLTLRSAKSGGPFDLIGVTRSRMMGVQVKLCPFGKVPAYKRTRNQLAKIQAPVNFKKELWVWERRRGFHFFPVL